MNALRHRAEIQSIECIDLFPNRFFDHNDDNIFLYRILLFLLDCDLVILFFFIYPGTSSSLRRRKSPVLFIIQL